MTEKLLTAAEVAELTGLNVPWILRKFENGQVPGFKLGDGRQAPVRFRLSEIEAWLDAQRRGPKVAA